MEPEEIPPYIAERIRRNPPPECFVIPWSTPIVTFGDLKKARVATIGLNPGRSEFLRNGVAITEAERRLETLNSLGINDLGTATDDIVNRIFATCIDYFDGRPYERWFRQFEAYVLKPLGVSYYARTACHLDLVQWATERPWSRLPPLARQTLLHQDAPFLATLLQNGRFDYVLLNGAAVIREFERTILGRSLPIIPPALTVGSVVTSFSMGRMTSGIRIIGWSTNLQSSFGVTHELRTSIGQRVAEILSE